MTLVVQTLINIGDIDIVLVLPVIGIGSKPRAGEGEIHLVRHLAAMNEVTDANRICVYSFLLEGDEQFDTALKKTVEFINDHIR